MTDRLSDADFDRDLRAFLAWQAEDVAGAPTALDMAARVGSRSGTVSVLPRLAPRLAWLLIAALAIAGLLGALAIGTSLQRPQRLGPTAYEAVFLRYEVTAGLGRVLVTGVNAQGEERQIASLAGAWAGHAIGPAGEFLAPVGAVSPGGLLAVPNGGSDLMMHWEIHDLRNPGARPIGVPGMVQFIEQLRETPYFAVNGRGGVFWGPGERLANLWYPSGGGEVHLRLGVVDGQTGDVTAVDVPNAAVLPFWASDGSGVFMADTDAGSDAPGFVPTRLLRLDGSVTESTTAAEASCRRPSNLPPLDDPLNEGVACLSPDDSMVVDVRTADATPWTPRGTLTVPGSGERFSIDGNFAGWLEVRP